MASTDRQIGRSSDSALPGRRPTWRRQTDSAKGSALDMATQGSGIWSIVAVQSRRYPIRPRLVLRVSAAVVKE